MGVVIVGKNAFLARALRERGGDRDWTWLGHDEALRDTGWRDRAKCVVNFAFPPQFAAERYSESDDIDLSLARIIGDRPVRYVMLSSRLVYGRRPGNFSITENHPLNPDGAYALNKAVTEANLLTTFGPERLTVLRLANVFGHELGRPLFFGRMLESLKKTGTITFDMDPRSRRDFFAVWHLSDALDIIAERPRPGIYNLGSGIGTTCGDIAKWVIEGYGSGKLNITGTTRNDQFWFNLDKIRAEWPGLPVLTAETIRADCLGCGEWLRGAQQ